jgi:uncharacterized glyoxalase superfamily protein PhnB
MSYDPATGFPAVIPILLYRDVDAAIDWLVRVFGFTVRLRATGPAGTSHCDLGTGTGVVMVEPAPPGYEPPAPAGKARDFLLVVVPDVDAHHRRALAAGAAVVAPPTDKPWGLRQYLVHDPEGHAWEFTQFLRDVPVEAWGLTTSSPT